MTDIKKLQDRCYDTRFRYCTFQDLALPEHGRWGRVETKGRLSVNFEDYDVILSVRDTRYCVAAIPVRLPTTRFTAIWHDHFGNQYHVNYPWKDVPQQCDLLSSQASGRPALRAR
jgi:hypothetical protein